MIREMQTNTRRRTLVRRTKLKRLTISTVGEDWGNFCCWSEGTITSALCKTVSYLLIVPNIHLPSNSTLTHFPKRNQNTDPQEDLNTSARNNVVILNLKLETIQMPIRR